MSHRLDLLFSALAKAKKLIGHSEYVIVGSLSAVALEDSGRLPPEMAMSNDFDMYTKADPGRIHDVAEALGEGSAFFDENDMYIDPVSPKLLTLPEGWEDRMNVLERDGIKAYFLEPNDAAISKYARGAPNDERWIKAGVRAQLIDLDVVVSRLRKTSFLDAAEEAATRARIHKDMESTPPTPEADSPSPHKKSRRRRP
ncbi:DUF6036 family nucleotidyltransferase [Hydrogenophaga sp. 2FB]|uniref:DUF6036 family nucleotidyltransferase n=1 Tax=Hydrogenophaga sp. 2FB TaxID=2502187 RepID=UPI001BB2603D|nr:DUF6036 family nucleotidyltransferase [Hydrogenophaga sp. 2FB]